MGEIVIRELLSLCLQTVSLNTNCELEFIQVAKNFEEVRKRWLQAEQELVRHKELLVKADVARSSLEVKLKHARNQVDIEIKKRHKAEADYQYLERQMQLLCDVLANDNKASLSEEQRSAVATFNHRGAHLLQQRTKRLSVIDESSFLFHSDVSYDRSDDDLDLDAAIIKPLKSRVREKRRSSLGPSVGPPIQKRGRASGRSGDLLRTQPEKKETECVATTPEIGGESHMVTDITQDTCESSKALQAEHVPPVAEETSVWDTADEIRPESEIADGERFAQGPKVQQALTPTANKALQHVFLSKTVIRPEMCVSCGKRIRFGKVAVKCRHCRLVAHPECKHLCPQHCSPSVQPIAHKPSEVTLESFAPPTRPRIPTLIVQCVNEIEQRGLEEKGIYRVPGGERTVKDLRETYVLGKGPLVLSKVDEIHAVCGLLKDFLRKLKEPLVTFKLHQRFMDACGIDDNDSSEVAMLQAVRELPQANRDTLAFLMLHLQKVMRSPRCQMDQNNLARVFGPTIIGHGMSEPSPLTIMKDTNMQPRVLACFLSFPEAYWRSLLVENEVKSADRECLFKPLTSPELSERHKTPASGPVKGKFKNVGTAFNNTNKNKMEVGKKKFFTSPS